MSLIHKITVQSHCNDLGGKVWNPAIRWHRKYAVFVTVEDNAGQYGIGECWCFDTTPDTLRSFLRYEVLPAFLGKSLDDVERIIADLTERATLTARHGLLASALSGIDIAIHDLRSRKRGLPLWQHLEPQGRGFAPLYASGGLYGADKSASDLATEVATMASGGFDIVKIKVGGPDMGLDIARAKAALAALSTTARLIIDGVYRYNADQALRLYEALPEGRIAAFQSPVPAWDFQGMARLCRAGVPVMATEAEYRDELHRKLIDDRAVVFLQTAPVACGGISRVLQLGDLIRDTPVRLSLEVSSTAIALMAACHLAAADDSIAHVEQHFVHQVFYNRLALSARPGRLGVFELPTIAGLGMELPNDGLKTEFESADPAIA